MKILAIESSCDDTAAAVCEGRNVLSSCVASQIDEHVLYGGVVPEIASRRHSENIAGTVQTALEKANTALCDIDAVAVTNAPGLIGALLVGVNFAKGLALAGNIDLVPVHHLRSHIAANYITFPELEPPFLCLVVSGGHSHLVEVLDYTHFHIIGRTRDDAAGECFDKTARAMGMPYPGGVHLDVVAQGGDAHAFHLPKPHITDSEWDFSFSGVKTASMNLIHNLEQRGEEYSVPDLAASIRKTVCYILSERTMAAAHTFGYKKIALAGGVSANSLLRSQMKSLCEKENIQLFMPALEYCGDNAAMVGVQGYYEYLSGSRAGQDLNAAATMSIENPE